MKSPLVVAFSIVIKMTQAQADACSNVHMVGSTGQYYFYDNIHMHGGYLYAKGVFLRQNEIDENKQSRFNLSSLQCDNKTESNLNVVVKESEIECKISMSYVYPSTNEKTCFLDFEIEDFNMKEINNKVLVGVPTVDTGCYQKMLTVNRSTKQVNISYTRINRKDCTGITDAFIEVLQDCPKERQY